MYRLILGKWNRQLWVELHSKARAVGLMAGARVGVEALQSLRNEPETKEMPSKATFSRKTKLISKANEIVVYLHGKASSCSSSEHDAARNFQFRSFPGPCIG